MIKRKNHELRGEFLGGRQQSTYQCAATLFSRIEIPEWMRNGTPCAGHPALFFPSSGPSGAESTANAQRICLTQCAHRGECAALAYRNDETCGIWGAINCAPDWRQGRSPAEVRSRLAAMAAEHGIDVGHKTSA